jgi:hypothetical protein
VLDASFYQATLEVLSDGQPLAGFEPARFSTVGGTVTAAAAVRGSFGFGLVGVSVGGRAGYHLSWAVTDNTTYNGREFTVLPTWYSHRGLLGGELLVGIGPWARLYGDLDLFLGYHAEGRTQVGRDPIGFGGRLQAGVDVDLVAGLFVRAGLDASAFNVNTTGVAEEGGVLARETFALEPFSDGQVRIVDFRGILGVGYHY